MLNFFQRKATDNEQEFEKQRIERMIEELQIKKGSFIEICFKDKSKANVKAVYDQMVRYTGEWSLHIFDFCRWLDESAKQSFEYIFCEDIESIIKSDEIVDELKKKENAVLEKIAGFRTGSGCFLRLHIKDSAYPRKDFFIEGDVREIGQHDVYGAVFLELKIHPLVEKYSMHPNEPIRIITPDYEVKHAILLVSIADVMEPESQNIVPTQLLNLNVGYR